MCNWHEEHKQELMEKVGASRHKRHKWVQRVKVVQVGIRRGGYFL